MPSNHISNKPYHDWLSEQGKKKPKVLFTHDFNITFSVDSFESDPWEVDAETVALTLLKRVQNCRDSDTIMDAIEHTQTISEQIK
jgi:hypothetical protein